MGLSISWVACYAPSAAVLESLDLHDTGEPGRAGGDEIVGLRLANDAYVVCMNGFGHPIVEPFRCDSPSCQGHQAQQPRSSTKPPLRTESGVHCNVGIEVAPSGYISPAVSKTESGSSDSPRRRTYPMNSVTQLRRDSMPAS